MRDYLELLWTILVLPFYLVFALLVPAIFVLLFVGGLSLVADARGKTDTPLSVVYERLRWQFFEENLHDLTPENVFKEDSDDEVSFYRFVNPMGIINARLAGTLSCKDGTSGRVRMKTEPVFDPKSDDKFIQKTNMTFKGEDFTGDIIDTYFYSKTGALIRMQTDESSTGDKKTCSTTSRSPQPEPEFVKVGSSGKIGNFSCSDGEKIELNWAVQNENDVLTATNTLIGKRTIQTVKRTDRSITIKEQSFGHDDDSLNCELTATGRFKVTW